MMNSVILCLINMFQCLIIWLVSHHMPMNYWCPLIVNDEWLINIAIFIIVKNVARNIYGDIMTWLVDHEYRDFLRDASCEVAKFALPTW